MMQRLPKIFLMFVASATLVAGFMLVARSGARAGLDQEPAGPPLVQPGEALEIQATRRISIPYGIDSPLPVLEAGSQVVVSGHGGCTAGQMVTIALTVTQSSSGALASGQQEQACNGELQTWRTTAGALSSAAFTTDPAQACGLATTYQGGYATDTYDWCREVDLLLLDQRSYLPLVISEQ